MCIRDSSRAHQDRGQEHGWFAQQPILKGGGILSNYVKILSKFCQNFVKFQQNLHKFLHPRSHFSAFFKIYKMLQNSVKNSAKFCKICKFLQIFQNFPKISQSFVKFCENLEIFANLLARRWFSCRSWKMLKNAYLGAKIDVDPAENEPRKGW